jgi:hypothetical protein
MAPETPRSHLTLNVPPFERVELGDPVNEVHLTASPDERHSVIVEGPPEMLRRIRGTVTDGVLRITLVGGLAERLGDVATTSLTRRHLVYRVRAPRLLEVRVGGYVHVAVDAYGADAPVVTRLEPPAPREPHAPPAPAPPRPRRPVR